LEEKAMTMRLMKVPALDVSPVVLKGVLDDHGLVDETLGTRSLRMQLGPQERLYMDVAVATSDLTKALLRR
jgi:hypothetical protein